MIGDQIKHDFYAAFVKSREHLIKIRHIAEIFHNAAIIADIIAVIVIRRTENRIEPDDINA